MLAIVALVGLTTAFAFGGGRTAEAATPAVTGTDVVSLNIEIGGHQESGQAWNATLPDWDAFVIWLHIITGTQYP